MICYMYFRRLFFVVMVVRIWSKWILGNKLQVIVIGHLGENDGLIRTFIVEI